METFERKVYALLLSLFIGGLVIAAVISSKIITVFGLAVPAGVLAYSLTFVVSDVISEVWGKEMANEAVTCGFVTLIFITAIAWLAVAWPAAPFWHNQEAFAGVIGNTPRIVAASLLAYVVSQKHDIWLFHLLKDRTNGRFLWLRNNLSTMVSQLIDSTIFVTVAFYGILPVGDVILGQWLVKLLIAACDTPIVYMLVTALKGKVRPVAA
ncbi:queuosine precursor transporter [Pseudodesulfovibrio sp. zrk46]|uniref:queuosine precursor transporter n=1 Tax=Pseudodesulfovibrio sp. zrk46 TaxID=2725288 RepID=UPI0014497B71|nr:queuosine precursor transporter [Pseudodesulfovibrio sp. zrk46]QJB55496.1 queuosine precursor transporter [Pseudodesulfovibrio sp. zrk46]